MLPDVLLHPPEQGLSALVRAYAGTGLVLVNPVAESRVCDYGIVDCGTARGGACPYGGWWKNPG